MWDELYYCDYYYDPPWLVIKSISRWSLWMPRATLSHPRLFIWPAVIIGPRGEIADFSSVLNWIRDRRVKKLSRNKCASTVMGNPDGSQAYTEGGCLNKLIKQSPRDATLRIRHVPSSSYSKPDARRPRMIHLVAISSALENCLIACISSFLPLIY